MPPNPLAKRMSLRDMQISTSEKNVPRPLPNPVYATDIL